MMFPAADTEEVAVASNMDEAPNTVAATSAIADNDTLTSNSCLTPSPNQHDEVVSYLGKSCDHFSEPHPDHNTNVECGHTASFNFNDDKVTPKQYVHIEMRNVL